MGPLSYEHPAPSIAAAVLWDHLLSTLAETEFCSRADLKWLEEKVVGAMGVSAADCDDLLAAALRYFASERVRLYGDEP